MRHKGLVGLTILSSVCLVLQLLPLVSVPVSARNLYLSEFRNFKYGVFGVCDTNTGACSSARIGYKSEYALINELKENSDNAHDDFELPSGATLSISKLLVVHVIAFCLSSLVFLLNVALLDYLWLKESSKGILHTMKIIAAKVRLKKERAVMKRREVHGDSSEIPNLTAPNASKSAETEAKVLDITPFLNLILFFVLIDFLASLLAFLIDILLFVPNLSYLGWIQLVPIISSVVTTIAYCFIKRLVSTRRYLQNDNYYKNDDMRLRKREINRFHDTDSDDGFYIYTGGFDANAGEFSNPMNRRDNSTIQ